MTMLKLVRKCPICKKDQSNEISREGYLKWQSGMLIQKAFPELNADQREMLITGICPTCWETLRDPEED